MSENQIDHELVNQVLMGDREAFDVLVLKYQDQIKRTVGAILHDKASVTDVTQEAFISAYRALSSFKGNSSFYTWLYRIAVNTAKNYIKHRSRRPPDNDVDFSDAVISGKLAIHDIATPESVIARDELQDAVVTAVNMLPEDLRSCMVLREIAGLSYEEIAKIMACPVGTVRSRIFRARLAVDEKIKPMTGS